MRWDIFCAIMGTINLVLWIGITRLQDRRIQLLKDDVEDLKQNSNSTKQALSMMTAVLKSMNADLPN